MRISFIYPNVLWLAFLVPLMIAIALSGPKRPTLRRFWIVLIVRSLSLLLIILALAGIQLRLPADQLTVVFLLDMSDSVPALEQARGMAIIKEAINGMPVGDKAGIVVFGEDALVERLANEDNNLSAIVSFPISTRTDLSGALQLGIALFPNEGAKRLVLLSDGRENLGKAIDQVGLVSAYQVELVFVPLSGPKGDAEVFVEQVHSPGDVHQGDEFNLDISIQSTQKTESTLRIFDGEKILTSQEIALQTGVNNFTIPIEAKEPGFRRYKVQIVPDFDTRLQNNESSAFTIIHGPPKVLIIEGEEGESENLRSALLTAGMDVKIISPSEFPTTITELTEYDTIVLENTAIYQLPTAAITLLPVAVKDLGKGFIMTGGQNGFGAGGYLRSSIEEILPVYMDTRAREETANLALVLVVDKSGSMGRCHCDNPDLQQTYNRVEIGQPKVDIAKAAVLQAASALATQDFLGVVAFDASATWAYKLNLVGDFVTLEGAIGGIQANGQTNIQSGVETAFNALKSVEARRKHIILLTDGWSQSGDVSRLVQSLEEQGITFSVVAAGGGSAEYLESLAMKGGGRYYPAEDILQVPDFFLKETVKAVGEYIIEEPFYPLPSLPGPALKGIDVTLLPPLLGYNGTSPKNTARIDLATPKGDPLLATWRYGLGKTAAWTSDFKGQWGLAWVSWDDFAKFSAQLIGWTLPTPQLEGVSTKAFSKDGFEVIQVDVLDESGFPYSFLDVNANVVHPDLDSESVDLKQVGSGKYEARIKASQPGTYLAQIAISDKGAPLGQQMLGFVQPYSPEYRDYGTDYAFLSELASKTGGGELLEPLDTFLHNLPSADFAKEIWRPLLFIVAFLFPLDVGIRRVLLDSQDIKKLVSWIRDRFSFSKRVALKREQTLNQLFSAKDKVRRDQRNRTLIQRENKPDQKDAFMDEKPLEDEIVTQEFGDEIQQPEDMLNRLKKAKKRAEDSTK